MSGKIRRYPCVVYWDEDRSDFGYISNHAWNLSDAPREFEFYPDFHKRVYAKIAERACGARVVEYDREGNVYTVREPRDQAEWDELHDRENPYWKTELEADQEATE